MSLFRRKSKKVELGHPVVGDPSKQIKADRKKRHREGALGMIIIIFALLGVWYSVTLIFGI